MNKWIDDLQQTRVAFLGLVYSVESNGAAAWASPCLWILWNLSTLETHPPRYRLTWSE